MAYLIETVDLTKYFVSQTNLRNALSQFFTKKGKATLAIERINFKVKAGEVFGLIGPNGAGKTTILKILSTLVWPTKGTAYINGYDILTQSERVKSSVGLISGDERSFYWRLTSRQNLEFYAAFYNIPPRDAKPMVNSLMELLQIEAPDKRVGEYSTGMRHRLSIARSLLSNPPILLMDEPTKSLDPTSAHQLRLFIKETLCGKQNKGVVIATHNLAEATEICDRIGIINQGRLLALGNVEELRTRAGVPREASLEEVYHRLLVK